MRKREHAPEKVWQAQELYCVTRLTFRATAEQVGVAESTVKRWADKHGWREKRDKIAQAECDIRSDFALAHAAILKKALEEQDAQSVYAAAALEKVAMKRAELERIQEQPSAVVATQYEKCCITSSKDAVQVLRTIIENKLNYLLECPEKVDLKSLAEMQKSLTLLAEMEAAHGANQEETPNKGMTADLATKIRELL